MKYVFNWEIGSFGFSSEFDSFKEAADHFTDFMKKTSSQLAYAAFLDFHPDVYDDPDTAEEIVDYIEDFFNGSIDPDEPLIINYNDDYMGAQLTSDGIYVEAGGAELRTDFLCVNDPDRDYSFSFTDGEYLEFSLELRRKDIRVRSDPQRH